MSSVYPQFVIDTSSRAIDRAVNTGSNAFSFEAPSETSFPAGFGFAEHFPRPAISSSNGTCSANTIQESPRDSVLDNDIADIIDGYAATPEPSFTPSFQNSSSVNDNANPSRSLANPSSARARRQSSVYQDVISVISEDFGDKRRKVIPFGSDILQGEHSQQACQENSHRSLGQTLPQLPRRYEGSASALLSQSTTSVSYYDPRPQSAKHYSNQNSYSSDTATTTTATDYHKGFNCVFRPASAQPLQNRSSVYTHLVTNGLAPSSPIAPSFYALSSHDHYGNFFEFSELRDKVVLVVNVSFYGKLAQRNFRFLNYLHEKYHQKGLVIIGFPCSQFNLSKPSTTGAHAMSRSNSLADALAPSGPSSAHAHKRSVSLSDLSTIAARQRHSAAHSRSSSLSSSLSSPSVAELVQKHDIKFPIFEHVKVNGKQTSTIYQYLKSEKNGLLGTRFIKWNFEKFVVDRAGAVHKRFSWLKSPRGIEEAIAGLLEDETVVISDCHSLVGFNETMFE